jgi:hypothetical protein
MATRLIDWDLVDTQWGDIMAKARKTEAFKSEVAFDDKGRIYTTERPMIESMICDKVAKNDRTRFYLDMLGFKWREGRIIDVNIRDRMPLGSGGKGKRCRK